MQCECITKTEKKLEKFLREEKGFGVKLKSVKLKNTTFLINEGSLDLAISIPFTVKADVTGYRSKNGTDLAFIAKFCPFCGVATSENKEVSLDE